MKDGRSQFSQDRAQFPQLNLIQTDTFSILELRYNSNTNLSEALSQGLILRGRNEETFS